MNILLVFQEAELTLPVFLADLRESRAERFYTTSEYADLRVTPVPLWELADLGRYFTMSIQFSRGCLYNCEFCNVTALLGHRASADDRHRRPEERGRHPLS